MRSPSWPGTGTVTLRGRKYWRRPLFIGTDPADNSGANRIFPIRACCMKPLPTCHRTTADTIGGTCLQRCWSPLSPEDPVDKKHRIYRRNNSRKPAGILRLSINSDPQEVGKRSGNGTRGKHCKYTGNPEEFGLNDVHRIAFERSILARYPAEREVKH